ncbi:hypothetical protein D3C80_1333050 [compost metagenome]
MATHHLADFEAVQAGDLSGNQNRDAHRAKCHRCRVNDQTQTRSVQRIKAQPHQQCSGNRHRRAKPRGPFEEGPEAEADDQHLQALVRGDGQNRRADNVKLPGFHRDFIDKYRGNNNPRNGPQTVEEAIDDGRQCAIDRHFVEQQRYRERDSDGIRRGQIAFQLELNQGEEKEQDR